MALQAWPVGAQPREGGKGSWNLKDEPPGLPDWVWVGGVEGDARFLLCSWAHGLLLTGMGKAVGDMGASVGTPAPALPAVYHAAHVLSLVPFPSLLGRSL